MIVELNVTGVGNLIDLAAKQLKRNVLVHGENGAGKSTLAAVFRSLQLADPDVITDRRTVGQDVDAEIELTLQDGESTFADGKWNAPFDGLAVFDHAFVNKNVHSGDVMNNDHGKSLYSVILGESCGELLAKAEAHETKVDDHNKSLRGITKELESYVPRELTLEQYLALKESNSLEDDIRRQEERVETLSKRKKLDRADGFAKIELPEFSESFQRILQKTIGNFLDNAEQQVYSHIEQHTKKASLAWIEQGCDHSSGDACPFCGQAIDGIELVAAYKGFFSREYNTLKAEINGLNGLIETAYGERVVVHQQKVLSENNAARQFWEDYIDVPPLDEAIFDELGDELGRNREKLTDLANAKKQNPLDEIELNVDLEFGSSLQTRLEDYNTLVEVANERIAELRTAQSTGNIQEEEAKLIGLKASGSRYDPKVVQLIDEWQAATNVKDKLSKDKKSLQKKIQKETKAVFASRGDLINELLDSFAVGYRLGQFDTNNRTKPPSVQIRVCFDGQEDSVRLDDKASKSERPFDAALSGGERSMLAFAFFITNLAQDTELKEKVIVIDDPITNLDEKRLVRTAEIIADIAERAGQLILLSHNDRFLEMVAEKLDAKAVQNLQLVKSGDRVLLE